MTETAIEPPSLLANEDVAERIQERLGRARLLTQHLEDLLNAHQCADAALLVSMAELIGQDLELAHDELDFVGD